MNRQNLFWAARPFMCDLQNQSGETVGLAVLDSRMRKGLIVGAIQGTRHRIGFALTPGTWFPPHTGAPAKAILAFLPPRLRAEWLAHMRLTPFTPQTITSRKTFRSELAQFSRKNGLSPTRYRKNRVKRSHRALR